jgi:hypothetical protein
MKSQRAKGKIPERLRDNSRWAPIGFRGFGTQEVELHGQHNSQNHEERNVERWVPSISQRVRVRKSKEWSRLEKIPKECKPLDRGRPTTIDLTKGEILEFGEWSDQWLGSLHFKLPVTEIPIQPGPLDRGRLIVVDLV